MPDSPPHAQYRKKYSAMRPKKIIALMMRPATIHPVKNSKTESATPVNKCSTLDVANVRSESNEKPVVLA